MLQIVKPEADDTPPRKTNRVWAFVAIVFFLGPAMFGFGTKFYELIRVFQGDPAGAFAITPIVNYLLAGCGFLLLFAWAAATACFAILKHRSFKCWKTSVGSMLRKTSAMVLRPYNRIPS